jgi:uncharacterized protein (DUF302 family)
MTLFRSVFLGIAMTASLTASVALAEQRHAPSDALFNRVAANVTAVDEFVVIAEIDHSRLAAEAGEDMPPSRVLIFSDPGLEVELMALDPKIGLDLPLRILAYEVSTGSKSKLLFNDTAYIEHRYKVSLPQALKDRYREAIGAALAGISPEMITVLTPDGLNGDGLIMLESSHGFDETLRRLREAVSAQDDTVWFGEVDFDQAAQARGVKINPAQLLLFGGPGPGGRAMSAAPSLGLDAFCQKVLVLQDSEGRVQVVMNDLLALAERHGVRKNLALRLINRRIQSTFTKALEK